MRNGQKHWRFNGQFVRHRRQMYERERENTRGKIKKTCACDKECARERRTPGKRSCLKKALADAFCSHIKFCDLHPRCLRMSDLTFVTVFFGSTEAKWCLWSQLVKTNITVPQTEYARETLRCRSQKTTKAQRHLLFSKILPPRQKFCVRRNTQIRSFDPQLFTCQCGELKCAEGAEAM